MVRQWQMEQITAPGKHSMMIPAYGAYGYPAPHYYYPVHQEIQVASPQVELWVNKKPPQPRGNWLKRFVNKVR